MMLLRTSTLRDAALRGEGQQNPRTPRALLRNKMRGSQKPARRVEFFPWRQPIRLQKRQGPSGRQEQKPQPRRTAKARRRCSAKDRADPESMRTPRPPHPLLPQRSPGERDSACAGPRRSPRGLLGAGSGVTGWREGPCDVTSAGRESTLRFRRKSLH